MSLTDDARAEAEKWLRNYHGSIDATALILAFLAGHEAASRPRDTPTVEQVIEVIRQVDDQDWRNIYGAEAEEIAERVVALYEPEEVHDDTPAET